MLKKINWGHGITIAIILLIVLFVSFIIRVTREDVHLVTEAYYESEMKYQHRIESIKNLKDLNSKVHFNLNDNFIEITLPAGSYNENSHGTILFYKASDKNLDREYPLTINEKGAQSISLKEMVTGKYKVLIEWSGEKDYFHEFEITIPSS